MLSKVSHEIRNPVALINSFLQLLVNNHPELKEDSCYLKIEENMDYLKALLDELSTYNHSHTADTEELNPYLLLQNITASAGALLEQQGIDYGCALLPPRTEGGQRGTQLIGACYMCVPAYSEHKEEAFYLLEAMLDEVHITVNKNAIPKDIRKKLGI